jgi:hypothetical protein
LEAKIVFFFFPDLAKSFHPPSAGAVHNMTDSESDDDGNIFGFLPSNVSGMMIEEDEGDSEDESLEPLAMSDEEALKAEKIDLLLSFLLKRDIGELEEASCSEDADLKKIAVAAVLILQGRHAEASDAALAIIDLDRATLLRLCCTEGAAAGNGVRDLVISLLGQRGLSLYSGRRMAGALLVLGWALLEWYCRENYTGPESAPVVLDAWFSVVQHPRAAELCARALEADGIYPVGWRQLAIPQALFLSRVILATVSRPSQALWRAGVALAEDGTILANQATDAKLNRVRRVERIMTPYNSSSSSSGSSSSSSNDGFGSHKSGVGHLHRGIGTLAATSAWLAARALVIHLRSLENSRYDKVPSLWLEATELFARALRGYGGDKWRAGTGADGWASVTAIEGLRGESEGTHKSGSSGTSGSSKRFDGALEGDDEQPPERLAPLVWLEWGLAQHHFDVQTRGRAAFNQAKQLAKLHTLLTAALGKRTKFQTAEYAQFYLEAVSSLLPGQHQHNSAKTGIRKATAAEGTLVAEDGGIEGPGREGGLMIMPATMSTPSAPPPCLSSSSSSSPPLETANKSESERVAVSKSHPPPALGCGCSPEPSTEDAKSHTHESTESESATEATTTAWTAGKFEIGSRIVKSVGPQGEEVAAREVWLCSVYSVYLLSFSIFESISVIPSHSSGDAYHHSGCLKDLTIYPFNS